MLAGTGNWGARNTQAVERSYKSQVRCLDGFTTSSVVKDVRLVFSSLGSRVIVSGE